MTIEDVVTLVKAGFTKDDIAAMVSAPEVKTEPETKPEVKTEPETKPEVKAEPETKPAVSEDAVSKLMAKLDQAVASMQSFALKTDGQPAQAESDYKSILSGIIKKE